MRTKMLEADVIDAIIGLGPNLFYNSPMEACIVICRSTKPAARTGKVLLIDAVNEVTRERAQSFLTPDHIERVVGAYRAFADDEGFAAVVSNDDVLSRDANLSIPLYVKRAVEAQEHDLDDAVAAWRTSAADLRETAERLFDLLGTEGAA